MLDLPLIAVEFVIKDIYIDVPLLVIVHNLHLTHNTLYVFLKYFTTITTFYRSITQNSPDFAKLQDRFSQT